MKKSLGRKWGYALRGTRKKYFEVGPAPMRILGGHLSTALEAWGWPGARTVRSRGDGAGMSSWVVGAVDQPPARSVVVGGSTIAHIKVAPPTRRAKHMSNAKQLLSAPAGPATPTRAACSPPTATKRSTVSAHRTWAQVVAGDAKPRPKAPKPACEPDAQSRKADARIQQALASLEKKTEARLAAMEKRIDKEAAARADQTAKIDAIFAFVQNVGASPRQASAHSAPSSAREGEPSQKRSRRDRRGSGEDLWVTLPEHEPALPRRSSAEPEEGAQEGKAGNRGPRKTTPQSRAKTAPRKRAQKRKCRN